MPLFCIDTEDRIFPSVTDRKKKSNMEREETLATNIPTPGGAPHQSHAWWGRFKVSRREQCKLLLMTRLTTHQTGQATPCPHPRQSQRDPFDSQPTGSFTQHLWAPQLNTKIRDLGHVFILLGCPAVLKWRIILLEKDVLISGFYHRPKQAFPILASSLRRCQRMPSYLREIFNHLDFQNNLNNPALNLLIKTRFINSIRLLPEVLQIWF